MEISEGEIYISGGNRQENQYTIVGRECFKHFYRNLADIYQAPGPNSKDILVSERDAIEDAYNTLYKSYGQHIGHYFRRLFNIFRFIDESKQILFDEKYEYARIVKSQLSNYEIKLLFYNSLTAKGNAFSKYIESYKLVKGIIGEKLINNTHWDIAKSFFGEYWTERVKSVR
jgi:hypothetical protein